MSHRWTLRCDTCAVDLRDELEINHGEDQLAAFLACGGVEAAAKLANADVDVRIWQTDIGGWCRAHVGHAVVVIDEYGVRSGACGADVKCEACDAQYRCVLKLGHDGSHERKGKQ